MNARSGQAVEQAGRALSIARATRINLGCGPLARSGWINCDVRALPGVNLRCDLRRGLPLAPECVDYIVAMHLLQDLHYATIVPLLRELRRVLKPRGILRLGLPDLDKALRAYLTGDAGYFYVPDTHARSNGAKLITQLVWYGSVRTPCNFEFIEEALGSAGYRDIHRCAFGTTSSPWADLASLDNRERESLFVEASK